jgi:YD repeat-containing protein
LSLRKGADRVSSTTDADGHATSYGYDDTGRLTSVTQDAVFGGLNLVTSYGYDEVGNRISQTDANGHTATFAYDSANRLTSKQTPFGTLSTLMTRPAIC